LPFEPLHVRAGELEAHCRLIGETCHPISLGQWRAARAGGPALPARPVLFTFDDGYRTLFTLARPLLERYRIPAVAVVSTAPVARAKAQLESWIGRPVTAFAYPNGRPGLDYTAESVALVHDLGFDFGFTTRPAFAGPGEPPLERSRFLMLAGVSPVELAHRL